MTTRERILRILRYETVDGLPLVHFGFWTETLARWAGEGHISVEEARSQGDANPVDFAIGRKLGFDCNYQTMFFPNPGLHPPIETKVIEQLPDGSTKVLNGDGVVVLTRPGAGSIPADVDHLLKDRAAWEEHFLPRLQFHPELLARAPTPTGDAMIPFGQGGLDFLQRNERDHPIGLHLGSRIGGIRNWLTMEGLCFLVVDDEKLFTEIVDTCGELDYRYAKMALETGAKFDFAHFWEDICFKNGPLVTPKVFAEKIGPHYRRLTDLARNHNLDIVSVDCDGCIDALVPIWLENGVNTMFPIEVGTWNASIKPWREKYGRQLRGVGGVDKRAFAADRAAVDAEIERQRPLVDLGGYIPCPDHRLAPDAQWDLVRYYCDRMRTVFG
ncbi:MAG: hypothetical protein HY360_24640 [Verrucomicrobia bacterium]|nr:hypothetical protein [Verrucomicrobiota bacterium]